MQSACQYLSIQYLQGRPAYSDSDPEFPNPAVIKTGAKFVQALHCVKFSGITGAANRGTAGEAARL